MDWIDKTMPNISLTHECESVEPEYLSAADFIAVLLGIIFVNIITIILSIAGTRTAWFTSLTLGPVNIWLLHAAWVIAILLSYVALFLFYSHTLEPCMSNPWPDRQSRNLALAVLFLIGSLLTLAWVAIFFYVQNLALSLWLVSIVFMYMFWVFMYMWTIMPVAAIFMIPLLVLYVVVFYSIAQLATLNNVSL